MTTRPSSRREGVGIVRHYSLLTGQTSFLDDVLRGLALPQKAIPAKYFYDERGSQLFEKICDLPEYYPTRTEMAMMQEHAAEMAACLGPECLLIEFGSGSGRKTRIIIAVLNPVAYVPIDIASVQLRDSAATLAMHFPELQVVAICADYSKPLALPDTGRLGARRRAIYFPGSTIGNFTAQEALEFLQRVRTLAGTGGAMLVGVDLKKDVALLNAAYNDARGVTAQFNLNLLARINRELGADFDIAAFRHDAFYNDVLGRIEMHLVSLKAQEVTIGAHRFAFRAGETIHTENSCKYTVAEFQALARSAGFTPERCWTDPDRMFAIHYLVA